MVATAGSALIQACEKAGVTIPRYFVRIAYFLYDLTDFSLKVLLP